MKERIRLLCRTLRQGSSAVTAIVTGCRGATPRSPGALLVLTAETALGTVGGGQAEHDIIATGHGNAAGRGACTAGLAPVPIRPGTAPYGTGIRR